MVETVIRALITLALVALCVFLVIWVLGELGIILPAMVVKILWIVAVLVAFLWLYRILKSSGAGWLP